jgi:AcrR family transcriptional regulator
MSDSLSKGEQTSQAIRYAAYTLFLEQGYHATSMRQIARRAGLALGGIYNHYTGKEQIFESVLLEKHPYRLLLQILLEAPGDTLEAFAQNAARAMLAEMNQHADLLKLMFIELSEFKGQHISLLYQNIFPQAEPLFRRFQAWQSESRSLPMHVMILSFFGTFFSFLMIRNLVIPSGPLELDDQALEKFIDIYLHGVINSLHNSPSIPAEIRAPERPERL